MTTGITSRNDTSPVAAVVKGAVAGLVGTFAMDLLWYRRHRREGGTDGFLDWELSADTASYDQAGAPAQVGKRIVEGYLQRELPPESARAMNNAVHVLTGVTWGVAHGVAATSIGAPRIRHGLATGAAAWAASYAMLAPAGVWMLSDCSSAALVSRSGSIDWLCLPRFDSPAVFARVLDPRAGHWSIRPAGAFEAERRYVPGTLVIETTFRTATGTARLTDALAFANGQRGHDLGLDAPHELLRSVEALGGKVEMLMELAPRPEYGLVRPLLRLIDGGARTFGGPNQIGLSSAVALVASDATVHARFTLSAGERAGFCLVWAPAESRPPQTCAPAHVAARIVDTVEGWRSWEADHDIYGGPRRELIRLSSRVLKGLSYRPMGAIVAAATTSLPEQVGSATGTTATRGSATRA